MVGMLHVFSETAQGDTTAESGARPAAQLLEAFLRGSASAMCACVPSGSSMTSRISSPCAWSASTAAESTSSTGGAANGDGAADDRQSGGCMARHHGMARTVRTVINSALGPPRLRWSREPAGATAVQEACGGREEGRPGEGRGRGARGG